MNGDWKFSDKEGCSRVVIRSNVVDNIYGMARSALPNETGGILIGESVGTRLVVVAEATAAPSDSMASAISFTRGTVGLVDRLALAWKEGLYYVGEWHAHPSGAGTPSEVDRRAMRAISRDASLRCPSPILFIAVGGLESLILTVHVQWASGDFESLTSQPRLGD